VSLNVDEAGMAKRIARTPVGRLGQVEDIANAAVFLAGDDSGFMTGESMLIDGGVTHAFL
jgi:3-oxoacyl-[acyl-carrier protein] reductase